MNSIIGQSLMSNSQVLKKEINDFLGNIEIIDDRKNFRLKVDDSLSN